MPSGKRDGAAENGIVWFDSNKGLVAVTGSQSRLTSTQHTSTGNSLVRVRLCKSPASAV